MGGKWLVTALAAGALLTGCRYGDRTEEADTQAAQPAPATVPPQPMPQPAGGGPLEIEVDLAARQLHVLRNGQVAETHPVAVGSAEWPTPTGEWTIGQVVFNPRWEPPAEEWAKDEEPKEPGDPENPLGRVQLVYSPPNTIHGTNQPSSLGQAVSHGSIRVSNEVGMQLARQVMEVGGAPRDEAFFQRVQQNRRQRESVSIPNPIPIRVVESSNRAAAGGAGGAQPGAAGTGTSAPGAGGQGTPRSTTGG